MPFGTLWKAKGKVKSDFPNREQKIILYELDFGEADRSGVRFNFPIIRFKLNKNGDTNL